MSAPHPRPSLPVLGGLAEYRPEWLSRDVLAGLISAAVVVPKAMAYAAIAGLPVEVGLYTALVPMAVYALLGTSRPLSVSTTTTLAILAASALGGVAADGDGAALLRASATLTLLVGAMLVLASLLRLGFIADFISEPVLIGFKAGIALVIVLDQVPKLLGVHAGKGSFFRKLVEIVQALPETSLATLAVGASLVVVLVALERLAPRVPAPLVVLAAGSAAAAFLGLEQRGVALVGAVPRGLPSGIAPDLSLAQALWPAAAGIALMSFTETIAAGRAFARSDEPRIRPNQELFATGLANACGAVLGAMPAGGGTSQTAVARRAGARSQLASLVAAGAALLVLLFLAPLIGLLPQAALAAVVVVYSVGLFETADFRAVRAIRVTEFAWALTALVGVLLLGTLAGILVAIVVSLVALAYQTADPPVRVLGRKPGTNVFRPRSPEHPEDEAIPGLLLLRPEGRIFFANAARVGEKLRSLVGEATPQVVALHLRSVPDLEYTALKMLIQGVETLRARGVAVWLVGMNPAVLDVVQRSTLGDLLGRDGLHFNLELAVAHYQATRGSRP